MANMTTRAAVLHKPGTDWEITEPELDPPKEYEVLIRYKAAGLCHSDELEQVNEGYHDLLAGKNVRGVLIHES